MRIPFNRPILAGPELTYIQQAVAAGHLSGDGQFTKRCHALLAERTGAPHVLLTHSCTAALEMTALLAEVGPGDEVIMPSFTFSSTANAFALRGATPVFVDVRPDTFNLDETLVEAAITPRTRAIVAVHYAGVGCEMDALAAIAQRHGLLLIEDAAQGVGSTYGGKALGSIGHLGTLSFHETKNVISGEGGALLVNDERFAARAEILREKGTNRSAFFRGQVDKYSWVDVGSSFLPTDMVAAFLLAQLESADALTQRRLDAWHRYHAAFEEMEREGMVRRPVTPPHCTHNAHMYYLILPSLDRRQAFIGAMRDRGIGVMFHYVPLHSSVMGQRCGRAHGALPVTDAAGERLVRLPMWADVGPHVDEIVHHAMAALFEAAPPAARTASLPMRPPATRELAR